MTITTLDNGIALLIAQDSVAKATAKEVEHLSVDPHKADQRKWTKIVIRLDLVDFCTWQEANYVPNATFVESRHASFILDVPFEEFDQKYRAYLASRVVTPSLYN